MERRVARLETLKASLESKLRWGRAGAQTARDLTELKRIGQQIARLQARGTAGELIATKAAM